jgi:hypothetical protein
MAILLIISEPICRPEVDGAASLANRAIGVSAFMSSVFNE